MVSILQLPDSLQTNDEHYNDMYTSIAKSTLFVALGLLASFASANPLPELEKRITCQLNYIPACCSFMEWESWPQVVPGLSSGCTPLASEPNQVCPAGALALGCCQQNFFTAGQLQYGANNQVYCYGQS
ncbi:hypothetical protein JR316_0004333 [Psilocybe cubensis]|uniref:Hydrophobin n=2 Tax=Psilocybe cubensis TaxID=181762 RepID=A0A8H7Y050_PSICU|nr:hypothetical protein JR316_0004333 [Psilocybe cubensis]KAH9482235.1 hypothetical protein JR316_0004333 [Psilocybe cubensis]